MPQLAHQVHDGPLIHPLRKLMRVHRVNYATLALVAGVSTDTVGRWVRGQSTPGKAIQDQVRAFFRDRGADDSALWPATVPRLAEVLRQAGITHQELADGVGTSRAAVSRWCSGKRTPKPDTRRRVERFLYARGVNADAVWAPTNDPTSMPHLRLVEKPMNVTHRAFLDDEVLRHFSLQDDPFEDNESNPESIFMPPRLQLVEKRLQQAIRRRQVLVLAGAPGAGKSSILRRLYGVMNRQKRVRMVAAASLDRSRISSTGLAIAILRDLIGQETSSMSMERRSELLRRTLEDQQLQGTYPCLLLDEAHLLNPKALLAIKQIWDSHILFKQLAVLLVGQLPLVERLRHDPSVRELTGRAHMVELQAYTVEETHGYVHWRFAQVHADADTVFTPDAYRALAARGEHPLWINNLATAAMKVAFDVGDDQVNAHHVGRV